MVDNLDDLAFSIAMYTTRCAEKLRLQQSYAHMAQVFVMTNPFRKTFPDLRSFEGRIKKIFR